MKNKKKRLTEEHKQKLSKARLGKHLSEKTKEKIRRSNLGKKRSKAFKEKIRQIRLGTHHSEETKIKIQNAAIKRFEDIGQREILRNATIKSFENPKRREMARENRLKQIIPFKDTSIEIKIQNYLDINNIIYIKHIALMGQPDIFIEPNICIFADGDYWHNFPEGRKRDILVSQTLIEEGYNVLRFWEHEINNNFDVVKEFIEAAFEFRKVK